MLTRTFFADLMTKSAQSELLELRSDKEKLEAENEKLKAELDRLAKNQLHMFPLIEKESETTR